MPKNSFNLRNTQVTVSALQALESLRLIPGGGGGGGVFNRSLRKTMSFLAQWRLIILENHGWNQSPQLIRVGSAGSVPVDLGLPNTDEYSLLGGPPS